MFFISCFGFTHLSALFGCFWDNKPSLQSKPYGSKIFRKLTKTTSQVEEGERASFPPLRHSLHNPNFSGKIHGVRTGDTKTGGVSCVFYENVKISHLIFNRAIEEFLVCFKDFWVYFINGFERKNLLHVIL